MNILLARHGNTFGPQDPVVWTGSQNDLPLVDKGIQQAETFAELLKSSQVFPSAVFCGPLERTYRYAEIISQKLGLGFKPQVDLRLNEIDYGGWTGLTHAEVSARYGDQEQKDWDDHSVWPQHGSWGGSEQQIIQEVESFASDLVDQFQNDPWVVVVSSNGRLRYFLNLIEGELRRRKEAGTFKVKTGNICKLTYENRSFQVSYWNEAPRLNFSL